MNVSEKVNSINVKQYNGGRALMIAYYFPPLSGSGVFRSIKFVKYLSLFNWHPTVISTDKPPIFWNYSDESQLTEIPKDVEVFRIHDKFNEECRTGYSQQRVNEILNFLFNIVRQDERAARIFLELTKINEGILALLNLPCQCLSWACDTFNYIESNIDISKFDVIYTTSGPYSAHLIGFYLSKIHNIPWIADWRDQWHDNPGEQHDLNNPLEQLKFMLENILLHQATCDITIVDIAVSMYIKNFNLPKDKITCITNGYDEADFEEFPNTVEKNEKFTISYSGLLYMKERNILPILVELKNLIDRNLINKDEIQFRLVGKSYFDDLQTARQFDLESIIVQTGYQKAA